MFVTIIDLATGQIIQARKTRATGSIARVLERAAEQFAADNKLKIDYARTPSPSDRTEPGHIRIELRVFKDVVDWATPGRTYVFKGYGVWPWNTPQVVSQREHTLEQKAKTSPMRQNKVPAR